MDMNAPHLRWADVFVDPSQQIWLACLKWVSVPHINNTTYHIMYFHLSLCFDCCVSITDVWRKLLNFQNAAAAVAVTITFRYWSQLFLFKFGHIALFLCVGIWQFGIFISKDFPFASEYCQYSSNCFIFRFKSCSKPLLILQFHSSPSHQGTERRTFLYFSKNWQRTKYAKRNFFLTRNVCSVCIHAQNNR